MSELVTIVMEPREKVKPSGLRLMRIDGKVPCVYYGPEIAGSVIGTIGFAEITKLLKGAHWEAMRINLRLPDGSTEMCLIREVQRNPLTGKIRHVDFMRLIRGRKITVKVPVEVIGGDKSPGVKDGGLVDHIKELEIETIPMNMPESIKIDVSAMSIHDTLRVSDIEADGFRILNDANEVVASVLPPRTEEAPVVEEGAKEVEVVAKGKAAKEDA